MRRVLEEAGAPKGSELQFQREGERHVIPFGVTERVTIWLDGVTLSAEAYGGLSAADLAGQIEAAMASDATAEIRGSWQGPAATSICIHGADAEVFQALEPVLLANPARRGPAHQ